MSSWRRLWSRFAGAMRPLHPAWLKSRFDSRQLSTGGFGEVPHVSDQRLLGVGCKEADAAGVEPAGFVAAFTQHASRRQIAIDVVAVRRDPKSIGAEGVFEHPHVIADNFARESDQRQII